MPEKITLPVTPDGNDPADYGPDVLEQLNQTIDQAHSQTFISVSDAENYVSLYQALKARCALRGQDTLGGTTHAHYEKCSAVLRKAGLV